MTPTIQKCVDRLIAEIHSQRESYIARCDRYAQDGQTETLVRIASGYHNQSYSLTIYRPKHTRIKTMEDSIRHLTNHLPENVTKVEWRRHYTNAGNPDVIMLVYVKFPEPQFFISMESVWRVAEKASLAGDKAKQASEAMHDAFDEMKGMIEPVYVKAMHIAFDLKADPDHDSNIRRKITTLAAQMRRDGLHVGRNSPDEDYHYFLSSANDLYYAVSSVFPEWSGAWSPEFLDLVVSIRNYRSAKNAVQYAYDEAEEAMDRAVEYEQQVTSGTLVLA
jgi:hypothetical protein